MSPEALSFFYPLSPQLALYLGGEPGEAGSVAPVEPITAEAVNDLNLKIARASHSQVFADAEKSLLLVQSQLRGNRPSNLSFTHNLSTEEKADLYISQTREATPDHHVARMGITGSCQVAT